MLKHSILGLMAVLLSFIVLGIAEEFNFRLREILGMDRVLPLITMFIYIVLNVLFIVLNVSFNASKNVKQEEIKESETGTTDDDSFYNSSDLYLRETEYTYDLRSYQIDNRKKETVWRGKCFFHPSGIQSIELYSVECNKEPIILATRSQDNKTFLITDKKTPLGYLSLESKGLIIRDLDMRTIVSFEESSFEKDDTVIIELITGTSLDYSSKQFIIKGTTNNLLGKYYSALRNIDLTPDIKSELDKKVCIIASIVIDSSFAGKKLKKIQ